MSGQQNAVGAARGAGGALECKEPECNRRRRAYTAPTVRPGPVDPAFCAGTTCAADVVRSVSAARSVRTSSRSFPAQGSAQARSSAAAAARHVALSRVLLAAPAGGPDPAPPPLYGAPRLFASWRVFGACPPALPVAGLTTDAVDHTPRSTPRPRGDGCPVRAPLASGVTRLTLLGRQWSDANLERPQCCTFLARTMCCSAPSTKVVSHLRRRRLRP